MSAAATNPRRVWTEAEIASLPDDGCLHEIVDGELVMSPKNPWYHGRICTRLLYALEAFNRRHRLGAVLDSSTGFWMANRNCRAPDVSFVSKARLAALGFRPTQNAFFPGAPDLAVEVLSDTNTRAEIDGRLKDYFDSGTQIAWVVDPKRRCVEVFHAPKDPQLVDSRGSLDGEHLLPGFSHPVADLFKDWDWD